MEGKFVVRTVALNLRSSEYTASKVREVRGQLKISQALFAKLLGVSPKTVQAWEQGVVKPSGMARRFLDEIRLRPDYYRQRLADSIKPAPRGNRNGC